MNNKVGHVSRTECVVWRQDNHDGGNSKQMVDMKDSPGKSKCKSRKAKKMGDARTVIVLTNIASIKHWKSIIYPHQIYDITLINNIVISPSPDHNIV